MNLRNQLTRATLSLMALLIVLPSFAWAGGYLVVSNTGVPYKWNNTVPIPRDIDGGNFGVLVGPAAVTFAEAAIDIWSAEPTLTLPFTTTSVGTLTADGDVNTAAEFFAIFGAIDNRSPIIFDSDGSLIADLGLSPFVLGFATIEVADDVTFTITESFQLYNGDFIDGDAGDLVGEIPLVDMSKTITHEMGHALNFDHSQVNGQFFIGDTDDPGFTTYGAPPSGVGIVEIMFPFFLGGGDDALTPRRDDLSTAEFIYGNGTAPAGVVSGTVFRPDGTTLLQGGNIIARNTANPFVNAVSCVSGYLFFPGNPGPGPTPPALQGTYDFRGLTISASYTIELNQVNPNFTGGSSVGPVDPPISIIFEEFWNGASEAASNPPDNPLASEAVTASATGINFILNAPPPGTLILGDDDFARVDLPFTFRFCGRDYNSVFVGSNGYITFGFGDTDFSESVADLQRFPPRIAALFDDLNPTAGGTVTALPVGPNFVITYTDIPEFPATGANTFSIILRKNGSFRIKYGALSALDGLVGRSQGEFATNPGEIDLSTAPQPIDGATHSDAVYQLFGAGDPNDLDFLNLEFAPCPGGGTPAIFPAAPGFTYGSTGRGGATPGHLLTINRMTGAGTLVGPTGKPAAPGLAIDSFGEIFGSIGGAVSNLIKISATTGIALTIATMFDVETGIPLAFVDALAFDKNDVLYAIDGNNDVWTVDPNSGEATFVGTTGTSGFVVGLAFQPGTGRLFGSQGGLGGNDEIYEIDPTTGVATVIGQTGLGGATPDLAFFGGTLYGTKNPGALSDLIKINTTNGAGTFVGSIGIGPVSGLASFVGRPFVFHADEFVLLDRFGNSEGNIHANETIQFKPGAPSVLTGNLTAVEKIIIDDRNTINGNVTTDDLILDDHPIINGKITKDADVNEVPLPKPFFKAGSKNIHISKGKIRALAPGFYGTVKVLEGATLRLTSGTYFFKALEVHLNSVVSIDLRNNAPVRINATNNLWFGKGSAVVISSGETSSPKVSWYSLQESTMSIGNGAKILGNLIVPNTMVQFYPNSRFRGTAAAKQFKIERGVVFVHHASTSILTKPDLQGDDEEAANEITSVTDYDLAPNYPNPFNPSTKISFALPEAGVVKLQIYDLLGNLVNTLVNDHKTAGRHEVVWNGSDRNGATVASGIYIYRLTVQPENGAAPMVMNRKMTFLK